MVAKVKRKRVAANLGKTRVVRPRYASEAGFTKSAQAAMREIEKNLAAIFDAV